MHRLLELRSAHSRRKILKMLLQEHIQREAVGLNPQRFTSDDLNYHELTDMERYLHSWRNAHADGGSQLIAILETSDAEILKKSTTPSRSKWRQGSLTVLALTRTAADNKGDGNWDSADASVREDSDDRSSNGRQEDARDPQDRHLDELDQVQRKRRRERMEKARQHRNQLKGRAQELRNCERRANAGEKCTQVHMYC